METTTTPTIKEQIEAILYKVLGDKGFVYYVEPYKGIFSDTYHKIWISCSSKTINQVRGQEPQAVSLALRNETMELYPQCYGGNGGNRIYREPDMNHPREKYLAMQSVKVPFKQPKKELKFVLSAIERFAQNYINTLKENKEVLKYKDLVDYDKLLS